MQLSSQLYAEIIGDTADLSVTQSNDERRRSPRAELGCRARVFPLMEAEAANGQSVLVRDVSLHGLGLLIGEPMTVGDEFVIHLPIAGSAEKIEDVLQIQCAVRRCQPGGTGRTQFLIGASFELVLNRPLSYAVQMPDDNQVLIQGSSSSEQSQLENSGDSIIEKRYDDLLAESLANRPERQSLVDQLTQFALGRLLIWTLLRLFSPLARLARRLGILGKEEDLSKIRSRLSSKRRRHHRKLTELSDSTSDQSLRTDQQNPSPAATSNSSAASVTYAEQAAITTLDTASQFVAGVTVLGETPSGPLNALERHTSLFAPSAAASEAASVALEHQPVEVALPMTSDFVAATLPEVAPAPAVVIPSFELPAELPRELLTAAQSTDSSATSLGATPARAADFVLQSVDPSMSVPRVTEPASKPAKTRRSDGPAWRSKHRIMNQSPSYRRSLGR